MTDETEIVAVRNNQEECVPTVDGNCPGWDRDEPDEDGLGSEDQQLECDDMNCGDCECENDAQEDEPPPDDCEEEGCE